MNNEIRQLVLKNSSSGEIREAAVRNGMRSLSDDGWRLIGLGVTTPEEVMRVTKDQTLSNGKNGGTTRRPRPTMRCQEELRPMPHISIQSISSGRHNCRRASWRRADGRKPSGKWKQRGLKPITLSEKASRRGAKKRSGAGARPGAISLQFSIQEGHAADAGEFHPAAFQFAGGGRAVEPRAGRFLCKEASNPAAPAKWKAIYDSVVDGVSLADSMATMPETFPRVYVAMVQAGETGGFLDLVLAQIADFQSREKDLRSKVMAALLYPAILLVLAIGVLIFLMTFFIPRFQTIFDGMGGELPLLTHIIVGASHAIRSYGFFIAVRALSSPGLWFAAG